MKVRLRDHLPLRFRNAVSVARRALQCEKLESRCLLHGLPVTLDYQVAAEQEVEDAAPLPVHVGQSLARAAAISPSQTDAEVADPAETAALENEAPQLDASLPEPPLVELVPDDALPAADPEKENAQAPATPADTVDDEPVDDELVGGGLAKDDATHEEPSGVLGEDQPPEGTLPEGTDGPSQVPDSKADELDSPDSDPDSDPDLNESDADGLPEPEGEAMLAPPQVNLVSTNSSLAGAASSTSANDPYLQAREIAPEGEGSSSLMASRVETTADMRAALGTLNDSLPGSVALDGVLTDALNSSAEDSLHATASASSADRSSSPVNNIGLALNAEIPAQRLPAQSLEPHSLLSQGLQTQSLGVPNMGSLNDASVPWVFSSAKLASSFSSPQSAWSDGQGLAGEARTLEVEQAAYVAAQTFASEASENRGMTASSQEADGDSPSLSDLRAAIEHNSRQRRAERALASDSMHEEVARHARRHIERAYLRVREGSDGLVELAIEHSPALQAPAESSAAEQQSASPERAWVFASMGLYREFDLERSADNDVPEPPVSDSPAAESIDNGRGTGDVLQAIDAAHAEDSSSDGAAFDARQQALPLGLLALTGLLAVSRHRFARKERIADEE